MKIVAVVYKTKKPTLHESIVRVFITNGRGQATFIEADLYIRTCDIEESLICDNYHEAHKKANLTEMRRRYNLMSMIKQSMLEQDQIINA